MLMFGRYFWTCEFDRPGTTRTVVYRRIGSTLKGARVVQGEMKDGRLISDEEHLSDCRVAERIAASLDRLELLI